MATKKIKRFNEGGMSDKDRGLEASKDEKVGFFERLRMGNIDDEGSEAYRRFGAGRGRAESVPVEDRTPTPVVRESEMSSMLAAGAEAGKRQPSGDASVAEMYQGPRTNPIVADGPKPGGRRPVSVQAEKPVASASGNPRDLEAKMTRGTRPQDPRDLEAKNSRGMKGEGPPRTTVGRTAATPGNIPGGRGDYAPVSGEKVEKMSDAERNISNMLAATGIGGGALGAVYKGKKMLDARKAAQAGAKKRAALKRDVEEGIDRNLADEFKELASSAEKSARESKTLNPNAWLAGPKNMADNFKRGGKVKSKPVMKKMASGGSVTPASKRADGIATRGKTRCKIC